MHVSTIFAGALITAMTWFVEGQESMLVRVVVAWLAGTLLALGASNHVIVVTLELIFGYRSATSSSPRRGTCSAGWAS